MFKGWRLVSLYSNHDDKVYIDFARYTGRVGPHGSGAEYDKVLAGEISWDTLREALRRHLELQPGNVTKK